MEFQNKHCHSLDSTVNSVYFKSDITSTPFGYSFYSKHSKIKRKNAVLIPEMFNDEPGERIQITPFKGSSKSIEVVYFLPDLFDKSKYESNKSYYRKVVRNLNLKDRFGLTIREYTKQDSSEVNSLHTEWVEKKLSDPRVHKISFSSTRYINCVRASELFTNIKVYLIHDGNGVLLNCFVVSVNDGCCFSLANFCRFWYFSNIANCCDLVTLSYMLQKFGDIFLNTGMATGSLKAHKQHYPNQALYVYRGVVNTVEKTGFFL